MTFAEMMKANGFAVMLTVIGTSTVRPAWIKETPDGCLMLTSDASRDCLCVYDSRGDCVLCVAGKLTVTDAVTI